MSATLVDWRRPVKQFLSLAIRQRGFVHKTIRDGGESPQLYHTMRAEFDSAFQESNAAVDAADRPALWTKLETLYAAHTDLVKQLVAENPDTNRIDKQHCLAAMSLIHLVKVPPPKAEPSQPVKLAKGPTANQIMLDEMQHNPDSRGWTVAKWAAFTGKARATIVGTDTWKQLAEYRDTLKANRAKDRRRK